MNRTLPTRRLLHTHEVACEAFESDGLHDIEGRMHDITPTGTDLATARGVAQRNFVVITLGVSLREDVLAHFLALDADERTLRFGHAVRDPTIKAYVSGIRFERDVIFGAYDTRLRLVGVGHLALTGSDDAQREAEFGVSVAREARRRGIGATLMRCALAAARERSVGTFSLHFNAGNTAMYRIARATGMTLQCAYGEMHGVVDLPPAGLQ